MARYVAAPDVCLVQSRLFSPGYAGIGRWVLFDAATRRAFSAAGRDVVPDVVRLIARASGGATYGELLDTVPDTTSDQLDRLYQVGLLVPADETAKGIQRSFASLYQRATFDYPFHDYAAPGARVQERELLDGYARLWPAPPSRLERHGPFQPLPRRGLLEGPPEGAHGTLNVATLGWVLQHSFGPIGEIKTKHVTCIRRTSPSGGARHPAEVTVEIPVDINGLPAGSYLYDSARHGLVRAPGEIVASNGDGAGGCRTPGLAFVVKARVERAMWRYRDLRALRPVLLDIGHIVETLALLLDQAGVGTTMVTAASSTRGSFDWLEEPPVAALVTGHAESVTQSPAAAAPEVTPVGAGLVEVLTNPAAVLRFSDGRLVGHAVWPERRQEALDDSDFLVLNHCVPSTRGDRSTSIEGIAAAIPGASKSRLKELADAGLLLPRGVAEDFYRAAGLWVRHDWYLSLLARLESLARSHTVPALSSLHAPTGRAGDLRALAVRRTTRAFACEPLEVAVVSQILTQALGEIDSASAIRWSRVFLAPLNVSGLPAMIHEWVGGELKSLDAPVTRDLVRDLTSGQIPAAEGACAVWLVASLDTSDPAAYELGLIELGRLGQRLCLASACREVGTFLTPAIKDSSTLALLGLAPDPATAAYLFSFGTPRSRT